MPLKFVLRVVKTETLKALRSPMFIITAASVIFMPLMLGLLMFIKKYPDLAQASIMLSKATMIPGNADWRTYFSLFAQMICGAGLVIYGFVASWIFGREYSDRTAKDLLALPLPRGALVTGKFLVMACWCLLLFFAATATALIAGRALALPGWSYAYGFQCLRILFSAALMNIGLSMLVSFVACWARGYLAPIGFVIVTLLLGNFIGMLGFGPYYPWGIPVLYAMKGLEGVFLGAASIVITLTASACPRATTDSMNALLNMPTFFMHVLPSGRMKRFTG
jgi:ABC-2 type transport system permease protein